MAGKARRTIARHAASCPRCSDPIEVGMAIRMWGGSWRHHSCEEPWLEGVGPFAHRRREHPQVKFRSNGNPQPSNP